MTTPTLAAFTLIAGEGRTPQPLNILGVRTLVKLADADTEPCVHGWLSLFAHSARIFGEISLSIGL